MLMKLRCFGRNGITFHSELRIRWSNMFWKEDSKIYKIMFHNDSQIRTFSRPKRSWKLADRDSGAAAPLFRRRSATEAWKTIFGQRKGRCSATIPAPQRPVAYFGQIRAFQALKFASFEFCEIFLINRYLGNLEKDFWELEENCFKRNKRRSQGYTSDKISSFFSSHSSCTMTIFYVCLDNFSMN